MVIVPCKRESVPYGNEHVFFSDETVKNNFYEIFNNKEEANRMIDELEDNILNDPVKAGRGSYIEIFGVSKNNGYLSVDYKIEKYEDRYQHPI